MILIDIYKLKDNIILLFVTTSCKYCKYYKHKKHYNYIIRCKVVKWIRKKEKNKSRIASNKYNSNYSCSVHSMRFSLASHKSWYDMVLLSSSSNFIGIMNTELSLNKNERKFIGKIFFSIMAKSLLWSHHLILAIMLTLFPLPTTTTSLSRTNWNPHLLIEIKLFILEHFLCMMILFMCYFQPLVVEK